MNDWGDLLTAAYGWQPQRQQTNASATVICIVGDERLVLPQKTTVSVGYLMRNKNAVVDDRCSPDTVLAMPFMDDSNKNTHFCCESEGVTYMDGFLATAEPHNSNAPRRVSESSTMEEEPESNYVPTSFHIVKPAPARKPATPTKRSVLDDSATDDEEIDDDEDDESISIPPPIDIPAKKKKRTKVLSGKTKTGFQRLSKWGSKNKGKLTIITNQNRQPQQRTVAAIKLKRKTPSKTISGKYSTAKSKQRITTQQKNNTAEPNMLPPIGTNIRRKYNIGWFDGELIVSSSGASKAVYDGGDVEDLHDDEEVLVGAAAFVLKYASDFESAIAVSAATQSRRPGVGTLVRKKYDEGWYTGQVVYQEEDKSLVRFQDNEKECMTDEELQVGEIAHKLYTAPETCQELLRLLLHGPSETSERKQRSKRSSPRNPKPSRSLNDDQLEALKQGGTKKRAGSGKKRTIGSPRRTSKHSKTSPGRFSDQKTDDEVDSSTETATTSDDSSPYKKRRAVGTSIRKRWDTGWYSGEIIKVGKKSKVRYDDGDEEWMSDEELDVAIGSHEIHTKPPPGRPGPGTRVRKRFDQG